jgi:hypothetical protein
MLETATESGIAKLGSTTGNIVIDVSKHSAAQKGLAAGAHVVPSMIGVACQTAAGQYEGTKRYKKHIGFSGQVMSAAYIGSTGGVYGAAAGAFVGGCCWVAQEATGCAVEHCFSSGSADETSPAMEKIHRSEGKIRKGAPSEKKKITGGCDNFKLCCNI